MRTHVIPKKKEAREAIPGLLGADKSHTWTYRWTHTLTHTHGRTHSHTHMSWGKKRSERNPTTDFMAQNNMHAHAHTNRHTQSLRGKKVGGILRKLHGKE